MKKIIVMMSSILLIVGLGTSSKAASSYTDVSDRYYEAVAFITDKGYAQGFSDTQFGTSASIKRIDAAVMVARVLGFTPNTSYQDAGFSDVPADRAWATNALSQAGVINGKTTTQFGSYDSMTRAEMAKVIANTYDLTASSDVIPFTDVNPRFVPFVAALVENNITQGKTATSFGSTAVITRGEFALFVFRAEGEQADVPPEVISVE
ncbi:S-layer homology domain-containing protein [Paenisporosarcina cavernae]|nr:S-layer homology domain-containing protein [Paenisporosarcina cavernae]